VLRISEKRGSKEDKINRKSQAQKEEKPPNLSYFLSTQGLYRLKD